jgi:hypothetical protein
MNLTWHQLKKDVRRTRVLLGLWLFVAVLRFALVGANANPSDLAWQTSLNLLSVVTVLLGTLLVMVLVPLIIQQEPLVGTTAFWLTRPISRATLLKEKSLLLLGLILVPLFIQTIVLLANGVTAHDAAFAAPEFVINQASWFITVAMLAVLTPSFGRFVIACAIFLVIELLSLYVIQVTRIFNNPMASMNIPLSLTASRGWIAALIVIGLGSVVILCQYLLRRYWLAVALTVIALLGSNLASQYWPWNFLQPKPVYLHDFGFQPTSISLKLASDVSVNDQASIRGGEPDKQISAAFETPGCPPGYVLRATRFDAVLQTDAGARVPVQPSSNSFNILSRADPAAIQQALGGLSIANLQNYGWTNWPMFSVSGATYQLYAQQPVKLSAQVHLLASKDVITAEMPVTRGSQFRRGSYRETITDVLHHPDGLELVLQVQDVRLNYDLRPDQDVNILSGRGTVLYALVNRKRNQAVLEKQNMNVGFNPFSMSDTLSHQPRRIGFGPENNQSSNWLLPDLDEAWLRDAVLVRLELTPVAEFIKPLTIPGFRLDGQFKVSSHFQERAANIDALENLTLRAHADRRQVHDYISSILIASSGQMGTISENDPQESMLEKVGAQNVDLLVAAACDTHNFYLNGAIDRLAQPDQKAMIIGDLPTNPDLISTVVDHGWQADARDTLLAGLVANTPKTRMRQQGDLYSYLPLAWIGAIVELKDPSTYGALKSYFINHPTDTLYRMLRSLSGFDLAGGLNQTWNESRTKSLFANVRDLLPAAAESGKPDVPAVLVQLLSKNGDPYSRQMARKVARQYTPAVGSTDDDLAAWLKANEANLVFDAASKKFVLSRSPIPSAPATPSTGK